MFPSPVPSCRSLAAVVLLFSAVAARAQVHQFYSTPGQPVAGAISSAGTRSRPAALAADAARNAAIADGVTTGAALLAGGVELHPLGAAASVLAKPILLAYAKSQPEEKRARYHAAFSATWSGAAANNACIAASMLSAGGFAPACIVVGLAWGLKKWQDTAPERRYWEEDCPRLRAGTAGPAASCVYGGAGAEAVTLRANAPRDRSVETGFEPGI